MQQQSITAAFGTIVTGLSIASLGPAGFRRLYELWQQRHVLVLRGPACDGAGVDDLVGGFGELEVDAGPVFVERGLGRGSVLGRAAAVRLRLAGRPCLGGGQRQLVRVPARRPAADGARSWRPGCAGWPCSTAPTCTRW